MNPSNWSAKAQGALVVVLTAALVFLNRRFELGLTTVDIGVLAGLGVATILGNAHIDNGEPAVPAEPTLLSAEDKAVAKSLLPPALAAKFGLALLGSVMLLGCTTSTPSVTQPSNVNPTNTTGQGGTDASAAQFFGFAVTRPIDSKTQLASWNLPQGGNGTTTRPVFTLRREFDPTTGKVTKESYDQQLDKDGKPILESVTGSFFIDARHSTFTNSVTPQGSVAGSGTTQSGTSAPSTTQTNTQTTSVPVTANVPITLPNGTVIPAGEVIPVGTPASVFPADAVIKAVK